MSRASHLVVTTLVLFSSLGQPSSAANDKGSPTVATLVMRTGEHPAFDRIVFDAPKGVTYKLAKTNNQVTLSFASAAKLTLPKVRTERAQGFHIVQGADGTEPLSLRFSVSPQATLKDFMSGTSIVIDIFGAKAPTTPLPEQPVATAKPVAPPPAVEEPKEPPKPVVSISPTPLPPKAAPTAQEPVAAAPAPAPTPEAPTPTAPPQPPQKEPPATEPSATAEQTQHTEGLAPTPEAAPLHPVATTDTDLPAEPAPFVSPFVKIDPKVIAQVQDILKEKEPLPIATFDPRVAIGAAIFVRGGYITILFDRKLAGDALSISPPPRLNLEPVVLPRNTGFRIAVPEGVGVRSNRKGTAWELFLTSAGTPPALSTSFVVQPEFALGARLLVSTPAPPQPIFFPDPVVGDDLVILPLKEPGAFSVKRQLSDFYVIPAAQGLVIKPRHEKVVARLVPDGVEITAEGGLNLSSSVDSGLVSRTRQRGDKAYKPLFDFDRWGGRSGNTFSQTRQNLMQTIIDVKEDERVLARLDLARFYFAQGNAKEALAILSVIQSSLPEIQNHPDFLTVRGGSYVWIGRVQEALADLNHPSIKDQPEAVLWKAVASAGLRDWSASFDQFNASWDILSDYPEPFRSKFSVLAIESAVAMGKDTTLAQWVSQFEKRGYAPVVEPALLYLKGVTYSKAGRADMAEKMWRQVVRGSDRLYKIRAELALVDLGVATKSLTAKQAVDRLEGLRFAWRGDDLELDILTRLGWFYMDSKDFRMGFQVLSQGLRLFPSAPATATLRDEMARTFHDLFMTELGNALSPIDALSLFTDYKSLLPAGESGNDVRKNLAERLIDIDLLEQAAKLLKDVAKNASKADERVAVATRLAAVSLLDRKADEAILYLDQSQDEAKTLPQSVQDERQLLRVRSLSELGKYDEALKMFPAQNSKAAMLLRADIAMRAKNWGDATKALMELIGGPRSDKPLTEEQASWLINAALCQSQAGDIAGLDRLAIDYGTAMDKTSRANLFRILTQPEKVSQFKDLQSAQTKLGEVDMFRGVLDSYRNTKKP